MCPSRRDDAELSGRTFFGSVSKGWAILIGVAGGILTLVALGALLLRVYNRTLGAENAAYDRLRQLSVDVQIDSFSRILHAPRIVNTDGQVTERLYVDPRYFVDAVSTATGKVIFYSVTTRQRGFHPFFGAFSPYMVCPRATSGPCEPARFHLGQSHMPVKGEPYGIAAYTTMAGSGYVESYGGDHAHNFLYLMLGATDTGYGFDHDALDRVIGKRYQGQLYLGEFSPHGAPMDPNPNLSTTAEVPDALTLDDSLAQYRAHLIVNEYAVATSDFPVERYAHRYEGPPQVDALVYGPKIEDLLQAGIAVRRT